MEHIDYSVIIRTTGKAGAKYQALLDSIAGLEPQPKEVIVVLPEGYALPQEQLGWETFYFCPKGMVIQRMTGIAKCKTPYGLICDDDVSFGPDFVQKLYQPIAEGLCGLSAGPLYSFLPEKGGKALIAALCGGGVPTLFHRNRYCSVLNTTGYSYNRHLKPEKKKYYGAQSLAWTCFFADIQALRAIELEDEVWLDAHGYSAYDDQTMFYKAWLRNIKTIVVADATYVHNDAKTSTQNNKPAMLYSLHMNRIIFWHRFLYSTRKNPLAKLWVRLALCYRMCWLKAWNYADLLRHRYSKEDMALIKKAHKDAWSYVKSQAYRNLPPVCKE
ncbi:MAG: glycosyltransferase [Ruminococcaceae bacterium]|nr:glycosyltransferase [Oscillospiraceae bacterium]